MGKKDRKKNTAASSLSSSNSYSNNKRQRNAAERVEEDNGRRRRRERVRYYESSGSSDIDSEDERKPRAKSIGHTETRSRRNKQRNDLGMDLPSTALSSSSSSSSSKNISSRVSQSRSMKRTSCKEVSREFTDIVEINILQRQVKVKWAVGKKKIYEWIDGCSLSDSYGNKNLYDLLKDRIDNDDIDNEKEMAACIEWMIDLKSIYVALDEEQEETKDFIYGFCCSICKCPEDKKSTLVVCLGCDYGRNHSLHHRFCCHNITRADDQYKSPRERMVDRTVHESNSFSGNDDYGDEDSEATLIKFKNLSYALGDKICFPDLQGAIDQAKRMDTLDNNEAYMEASDSAIYTNLEYLKFAKEFHSHEKHVTRQRDSEKKSAVVLDVFAGVGTGVLVLKKLQIAMKKIISVEMCPFAVHVNRHNHDSNYNQFLDDDEIEHIYIKKFEDIQNDLDQFMKEHGPIDIILGGPPCQDHAAVNAYRHGSEGAKGKLLYEFGKLINSIKNHQLQDGCPVYFVAENVILNDEEEVSIMEKAYTVPLMKINAKNVSPCCRNRSFWTSIPVLALISEEEEEGEEQEDKYMPNTCLDPDWMLPAQYNLEVDFIRANTFMASKSRLDDYRMWKIRQVDLVANTLIVNSINSTEREKMMGFPVGYIQNAIFHLFNSICNAISFEETEVNGHWKNKLPIQFHHFSHNHISIIKHPHGIVEPFFDIKMMDENEGVYYNREQFVKRLVGNAWSVPVAYHIMKKLQCIYKRKDYGNRFNYRYEWE